MQFVTAINKNGIETHSFVVDADENAEVYALVVRTDQEYRELLSWNLWDAEQNQLTDGLPELKDGLPAGKMLVVLVMNDTVWRVDADDFACDAGKCHVRLTSEFERLNHVAALLTRSTSPVVKFDVAFEDPLRSVPDFRVANQHLAQ